MRFSDEPMPQLPSLRQVKHPSGVLFQGPVLPGHFDGIVDGRGSFTRVTIGENGYTVKPKGQLINEFN